MVFNLEVQQKSQATIHIFAIARKPPACEIRKKRFAPITLELGPMKHATC